MQTPSNVTQAPSAVSFFGGGGFQPLAATEVACIFLQCRSTAYQLYQLK